MATKNVLEDQPGKADEDDKKSKTVAELKADAQGLKPVRHYPLAATGTGDFVKEDINDLEDFDEDEEEEDDETLTPADIKNRETERKKAADKLEAEAKAKSQG